jgi:hypothetical protein
LFREGYYYDYAARVAIKRREAAMRAFRRKSLSVKQLAGKMHYEVARKPRWVGGNPVVTPTQLSISDLAPYLAPSKTNGETRRRRRGATAERSPSIDGTSSFEISEKKNTHNTRIHRYR